MQDSADFKSHYSYGDYSLIKGLGVAVICNKYLKRKNGGNLGIRSGVLQAIDS